MYINDHVLSRDMLDPVRVYLEGAHWTYGWKSDHSIPYGHWNTDITHTLSTNPTDVTDRLPLELSLLWKTLNASIFGGDAFLSRCYANRHTFGTDGYLHVDSDREEDHTVIIYMNPEWEINWGGETILYVNGEAVNTFVPKYGRVVVFPGRIEHKVASVTKICPEARTTLMFKVSINPKPMDEDEKKLIDFLHKVGADKVKHKIGTLFEHLYRVYKILKEFKAPDYVCLAGGLHSVLGTNLFKQQVAMHKEVEEIFGSKVFNLVRLFSRIDRPHVLENPDGVLSDQNLNDLRMIECANLYDQSDLNETQYPNLYKFVKELK